MATVKFYRDETICSCCGRYIVNVISIDEVPYGTTCGEYQIKSLGGSYKVQGKTPDFAAKAMELIEVARKARVAELYDRLPAVQWMANVPTGELVEYFVKAYSKLRINLIDWCDARLQIRDIDTDAIIAREWQIAMME